jgi:hypothetical protein
VNTVRISGIDLISIIQTPVNSLRDEIKVQIESMDKKIEHVRMNGIYEKVHDKFDESEQEDDMQFQNDKQDDEDISEESLAATVD